MLQCCAKDRHNFRLIQVNNSRPNINHQRHCQYRRNRRQRVHCRQATTLCPHRSIVKTSLDSIHTSRAVTSIGLVIMVCPISLSVHQQTNNIWLIVLIRVLLLFRVIKTISFRFLKGGIKLIVNYKTQNRFDSIRNLLMVI